MTLTRAELAEVVAELEASLGTALTVAGPREYRPRYNLAPTDKTFIVLPEKLTTARWGFRAPSGPAVINARAETLAERPLFKDALQSLRPAELAERGRCLIPADGFYEWQQGQPVWFHRPDGRLLLMAGLYQVEPDGELAFTIITTAANSLVAPIHNRMPALLTPAAAIAWLARPRPDLLSPAPDSLLVATYVSDRVSSIANDDPACLTPARPRTQLKLF